MRKIINKEFLWYLGCGLIAFLGLLSIVFGIIGYHMSGSNGTNFVLEFEEKIKFELRYIGLIFIAGGLVLAVITLLYNAKKADREVEKKIRREQRLAAQANQTIEVKKAVEIIEEKPVVEVQSVESK